MTKKKSITPVSGDQSDSLAFFSLSAAVQQIRSSHPMLQSCLKAPKSLLKIYVKYNF